MTNYIRFYQRHNTSIWLIIITIIGIIVRMYGIFQLPFTHDELSVEARLHYDTFSQLIKEGVLCEGHPAGIQVFIWYWGKLFGFSEFGLRFPFLILGIACIPLSYAVTKKWFNENAALFVAAYFAVSQYAIFYSVVIRPYIPGLFFCLSMLYYWSKIIYNLEYNWKNTILMGIFGALCAYTHQFSMLSAFLLGITGLFFIHKKYIKMYITGCLLAVILYIPHIPILIHQIQLGGVGGAQGWLAKPTPDFFILYPKYLFHFSRYMYLLMMVIIGYYALKNRSKFKSIYSKQLTAIILFLTQLLIAYFYSIFVNPVLQFSVLLFSSIFLLLFIFSVIDEKSDILKKIFLLLMLATMLYSLIYQRKHFEVINKQWYELSVKKALKYKTIYGEKNISCMLKMEKPFLTYYERMFNDSIHNLVYIETNLDKISFYRLLDSLSSNYLITAGLSDMERMMIQEKYPYIIDCEECFTSEIIVFSKTKLKQSIYFPPLYSKTIEFDSLNIDSTMEFIPIASLPFLAINDFRYTLLTIETEYIAKDSNLNFLLVLETKYKDRLIDWRSVESKDFPQIINQKQRIYLPLRYELLFKNSRKMKDVALNIYLWNLDKKNDFIFLNTTISAYKDNKFIYGLVECLE